MELCTFFRYNLNFFDVLKAMNVKGFSGISCYIYTNMHPEKIY
jgi:hypothetical protein